MMAASTPAPTAPPGDVVQFYERHTEETILDELNRMSDGLETAGHRTQGAIIFTAALFRMYPNSAQRWFMQLAANTSKRNVRKWLWPAMACAGNATFIRSQCTTLKQTRVYASIDAKWAGSFDAFMCVVHIEDLALNYAAFLATGDTQYVRAIADAYIASTSKPFREDAKRMLLNLIATHRRAKRFMQTAW